MEKKTGLVLLAAASSRGKGNGHHLPPIEDELALDLCVRRIQAAGITEMVVVVGHDESSPVSMPKDLPVSTVTVSPTRKDGQENGSVRAGIAALPAGITGIVIAALDQPFVLSPTYALLANVHLYRPDRILMPTYHGRDGFPVLFPVSLFGPDSTPDPPERLLSTHRDRVVRLGVEDPGILNNMDYANEYSPMAQ
ncbi:MAG: NTP transferase domain-containing protein [Desulfobulbaceae bacterium]|jgi:CTP:molybdopterin cytidylyltransferase MocA|nr:NTP transferase domain-containing protein [Desulfobulbaceae bacterium]MDY0351874.1 NTP transferase domain-containing protein [Desulfobulbaceae bacterium]